MHVRACMHACVRACVHVCMRVIRCPRISTSNYDQLGSSAVVLECGQACYDLYVHCRAFSSHCCSGVCPRPTVQARQQFSHTLVLRSMFVFQAFSMFVGPGGLRRGAFSN